MKKCDLRLCDVLELRNGDIYILIKGSHEKRNCNKLYYEYLLSEKDGGFIPLYDYDDDLRLSIRTIKFDIVKVKHFKYFGDAFKMLGMIKTHNRESKIDWDWVREETGDTKEVTMSEVEEKFGCKVKIVKG